MGRLGALNARMPPAMFFHVEQGGPLELRARTFSIPGGMQDRC